MKSALAPNVTIVPDPAWLAEPSWRDNFLCNHLSYDCRCLQVYSEADAEQFRALGYEDGMDYIVRCLGLDRQEVETVLETLQRRPDSAGPLSYGAAQARVGLAKGQRSQLGWVLRKLPKLTTAERSVVRAVLNDGP
jgi:hypothetical protein